MEPASTARARALFSAVSWASWYWRQASAPATAANSSSAASAASAIGRRAVIANGSRSLRRSGAFGAGACGSGVAMAGGRYSNATPRTTSARKRPHSAVNRAW